MAGNIQLAVHVVQFKLLKVRKVLPTADIGQLDLTSQLVKTMSKCKLQELLTDFKDRSDS